MRYLLLALLFVGCKKENTNQAELRKVGRGNVVVTRGQLTTDFCCLKDMETFSRFTYNGEPIKISCDSGEVMFIVNGRLKFQGKEL